MYYYIATRMHELNSLASQRVLEIGSGRGGGLNFISQSLSPEQCIGVDISRQQVEFCSQTYSHNRKVTFMQGDAENLDLPNESVDMVINIESSHCYGNISR